MNHGQSAHADAMSRDINGHIMTLRHARNRWLGAKARGLMRAMAGSAAPFLREVFPSVVAPRGNPEARR